MYKTIKVFVVVFVVVAIRCLAAPVLLRVVFTDKGPLPFVPTSAAYIEAAGYLGETCKEQRRINGAGWPLEIDRPVEAAYLSEVSRRLNATVLITSRWLNSALFEMPDVSSDTLLRIVELVQQLPYVASLQNVRTLQVYGIDADVKHVSDTTHCLPAVDHPDDGWRRLLRLDKLHEAGLLGDADVAVIDNGFRTANIVPLAHLRVASSYDAIYGDSVVSNQQQDPPNQDNHGTSVLSVLAAWSNAKHIGAAPFARYHLVKSEDMRFEQRREEDYIVAAIEYAERKGAKVVNISLGYRNFDSTDVNTPYSVLDGTSTWPAKAVNIASSLGVCVVVAAGNQGPAVRTIATPADADSAITVGSIALDSTLASFSSSGPTASGVTKPNLVGVGTKIRVINADGSVAVNQGTSLSAPQIAGAIACLYQSVSPATTRSTILEALYASCTAVGNVVQAGKGLPDIERAASILQGAGAISSIVRNGVTYVVQRVFGQDGQDRRVEFRDARHGRESAQMIRATVTDGWWIAPYYSYLPDTSAVLTWRGWEYAVRGHENIACGMVLPPDSLIAIQQQHFDAYGTMKVWPNPALQEASATVAGLDGSQIHVVVITDAVGQEMQVPFRFSESSIVLDTKNIASGRYVVSVSTNTRVYSSPLVILR
jgi:serine protease AprX